MNRPLGRLEAAATSGQHCPQMTQRRCMYPLIRTKNEVAHLILAAAFAAIELGGLRLAAEDGDAVPAALGAPPPPEHRAAVVVVVLQRLAALRVRQADPLRLAATAS